MSVSTGPRFTSISLCLIICLRASLASTTENTARQTIFSGPQFSAQIQCVRDCIVSKETHGACWIDRVASTIGCDNSAGCAVSMGGTTWAARDECYCRTDLQPAAQSAISLCVSASCTIGDMSVNLASGGAVYRDYCGKITTTGSGGATAAATPTGGPTQTVYVTVSVTVCSGAAGGFLAHNVAIFNALSTLVVFLVYSYDQ
ncbi:hypothetical protein B0T24DRAFT_360149 [Lasiosphaeria ovina]|uniref:Extracellular membrane protein CFEM domain-containing protein n=1 Tax=Lasiosphaeria ovina TaxID=92902 RepID=A0AAE0N3D7_9PEZI|nr:hypothetical protein B0T24DRAFT_360149 [Lasiosphaeria ovina]